MIKNEEETRFYLIDPILREKGYGWPIIVGFYDRILRLTFYPSWLSQNLQTIISNDWPRSMFI